jgi:Holliday junction resolvase
MAFDKHRGAISELIACAWLLEQGYEVFRNVSACGLADLVAFKDGATLLIDVKTANKGARVPLKPEQFAAGVVAIYVKTDGDCELILEPPLSRAKPIADEDYNAVRQRLTSRDAAKRLAA